MTALAEMLLVELETGDFLEAPARVAFADNQAEVEFELEIAVAHPVGAERMIEDTATVAPAVAVASVPVVGFVVAVATVPVVASVNWQAQTAAVAFVDGLEVVAVVQVASVGSVRPVVQHWA